MPIEASCQTPDGATLNYRIEGEGSPLALISGLGGTAAFWSPLAERLAADFRVLSFDQRGIAGSTRGAAPEVTVELLAEDAAYVIEAAFPGERVHLHGHSTGGAMVQHLAAERADIVRTAMLSGAWLRADGYMHELFALRSAIAMQCPEQHAMATKLLWGAPPGERQAMRDAPPQRPGEAEMAVFLERVAALLAFDGGALCARIDGPCLVLGARDDLVVPFYHQQELHSALPGSEFAVRDDGGHFFPATRTDWTATFIRRWTAGR